MAYPIRTATTDDVPALAALIARSARALSTAYYRAEQVEGALAGAFGVDSQLIADGTYYVVEVGSRVVVGGGWSYRRTLFGGDAHANRDEGTLDPAADAAKIRAFFIDPDYARRGIGRALLAHCEAAAHARGFRGFELMATLPGVPLYRACGYEPGETLHFPVTADVTIEFVPMRKGLVRRP